MPPKHDARMTTEQSNSHQKRRSRLSEAARQAISDGIAARDAESAGTTSEPLARSGGTKRTSAVSSTEPPAKRIATAPLVVPAHSGEVKESRPLAGIFMSAEQRAVLEIAEKGESVFFTGSAGTGKSVLLQRIISVLQKKYPATGSVAVTASTGMAACNIGGITLHSFAGIGLGADPVDALVKAVQKNPKARTRWMRTKVLIIDEVSMVEGKLFDKIARVGSALFKSEKPFGGIQLVITGDFFPLPPVTKNGKQPDFAFEADMWTRCIKRSILLTKVFRQKDKDFVQMLNDLRHAKLRPNTALKFAQLARPIVYQDGIEPTELFPRREDVKKANTLRLEQLTGDARTFLACDSGTADEAEQARLLANFMAPEKLRLKIGAQVMLIKNIDDALVNGSVGIVTRFVDPAVYESELAGAAHPVHGSTKAPKEEKLVPVVEFSTPNGDKITIPVLHEEWKVELPTGVVLARRKQIPLILSWAMSIHKSQGQTLMRVRVDLQGVFERGQAYVALLRATSMDGLQVLNFDPKKVLVYDKVVQWNAGLEQIGQGAK